ncbi:MULTISPECIES: hypothetical protein [Aminobacter]|jgi:hypothetical protein|uniref:Flagellar protein n=2 Tax=Aminobacter TaxID=31988 RepID=A0AAC8YMA8_AMIAI|nr:MULTISPECIES: hypothetical protein [Aminobacter]AMS41035.1 hypothetical protein AA2016_2105 [Aminobacter aminovorans]MBA8909540.1 hypothetical protein [Aminobacter ciceronei]MBA9023311.1 hypothetical protein [Aminobacter ciceronei]MBB3705987.1 hypothetical protein [Aminobacter aminovorans]MRX35697.1 hypothetical protein [Aminobacter sp. MDW-2]
MFRRNDPASEFLEMIGSKDEPRTLMQRLGLKRGPLTITPKHEKKRDHRSDFIIAALGIALGLTCALFPWYIFFNQDKFGIRAMKFSGGGQNDQAVPLVMGEQVERVGAPMTAEDIPPMKLDLFATGSLRPNKDEAGLAGIAEQPFPGPKIEFKLVHIANGRAMVEDDAGVWVVQRGSVLPDSSRVASIEQRDGKWVLVTSREEVFQVAQ